ncbi:MAG: DUF2236 domain-containing protein [Hyphomicrobiales bacterium]|nr:DUF2236 domain-containing protein [Hyphomicrobiales bacterium]
MKSLPRLIDASNAAYSDRYPKRLLDELMFAGDPLADAAVAALNERAYQRTGAKLEAVRALAAEGEPAARAFVEAASETPAWLDERLLAHGQKLTLGFVALSRLSLLHSLFAGGLFARATLVTRATGRLGADPSTRIRETGAFIGAIMQPGGMAPGAVGHETTLRVRLLHSSIRAWLKRTPGFSEGFVGEPIDQTMLAMTLSLFSYLYLRTFARLGVVFGDRDLAAHHHLWRYVGHVLGVDSRLLAPTLDAERELWSALVAHQAFPGPWGRALLGESARTAARLAGNVRELKPFFRALFLQMSGPGWFGVDERAQFDHRLAALRVGAGFKSLQRRFVPGVADTMAERGLRAFAHAVDLARAHDYGVRIETPEEHARSAAALEAVAAEVRARFADLSPRKRDDPF